MKAIFIDDDNSEIEIEIDFLSPKIYTHRMILIPANFYLKYAHQINDPGKLAEWVFAGYRFPACQPTYKKNETK